MKSLIVILISMFMLMSGSAYGDQSSALWPDEANNANKNSAAPVSALVQGLADRLHKAPDDPGGWMLLAKSYRHLDRPADARKAYLKAAALGESDPDLESWLSTSGQPISDFAAVQSWLQSREKESDYRR